LIAHNKFKRFFLKLFTSAYRVEVDLVVTLKERKKDERK